jgi:predicted transcriptional regulator
MMMIFSKYVGRNNIKDCIIKVANDADLEFAQGLQNLGVHKNVASLITYLKDVKEVSSKEIEIATDLRQPEVSIAMRTLRERGWLAERELKKEGKGRPMKIYALQSTIDDIIDYYEAEKTQESAQTMEAIQRLKELSSA